MQFEPITNVRELVAQLVALKKDIEANCPEAATRLQDITTQLLTPGRPENPITIKGKKVGTATPIFLTIMRLWLEGPAKTVDDGQQRAGVGVKPVETLDKKMSVMVWEGDPSNPLIGGVEIKEDEFVRAIAQLFPRRELWNQPDAASPLDALRSILADSMR